MVALVNSLRQDEGGATAIEYALIAGIISITVMAWATFTGTTLSSVFQNIGAVLASA